MRGCWKVLDPTKKPPRATTITTKVCFRKFGYIEGRAENFSLITHGGLTITFNNWKRKKKKGGWIVNISGYLWIICYHFLKCVSWGLSIATFYLWLIIDTNLLSQIPKSTLIRRSRLIRRHPTGYRCVQTHPTK